MEELRQILRQHALRYPQMEPTDAVKLVYQNEFGGGHLIRDPQACLVYLQKEYDTVEKDPGIPLYEDIGNGIVRVNLAALAPEDMIPLGERFIRSAQAHKGTRDRFVKKLDVLCQLAEAQIFAFDPEALDAYLTGYRASGYPPVSHSEAYRAAYHPAYRIVLKNSLVFPLSKAYNRK